MATPINSDAQVQSGATLSAASGGNINATEINGVPIPSTNSGTAGKIPITQGDGSAAWADPFVQGVYAPGTNTSTGGISGGAINPVLVGGSDYAGTPLLRDLKVDSSGNIFANDGIVLASLTTISAANSNDTSGSTQNVFTNSGASAVLVQLTPTGTISAGAITFEVSFDGSTWQTIPADAVLDPTSVTFAQIALPFTPVSSTNKYFILSGKGWQGLRIKVSTTFTGTGHSVAVNYALLNYDPAVSVIAYSPTAANFNATVTFSAPQHVVVDSGAGTQFADNAASGSTPTGTLGMAWDSTNSKVRATKADASQNLMVNVAASALTDPAEGSTGSAVPSKAIQIGASDGTNLQALRIDSAGGTYVNIEGRKKTYSCFASFTAAAGDISVMPGNATTTVRVTRVEVSLSTSGTAAIEAVQLVKRSAADTGGTSSNMTVVPHDSSSAAASSVPKNYTVAPTPGAAVGTIRGVQFNDASSTAAGANTWIWTFGERGGASAIVLHGTAEQLAINLGAAVATQTATVSFEWTEE